jgi:hypothetical protein
MLRLLRVVLILFASVATPSPPSLMSDLESAYADFNDANAAISTIDSGYSKNYAGRDRAVWQTILDQRRQQLTEQLAALDVAKLSTEDVRAVTLIRASVANASESETSKIHCADSHKNDLDYHQLSRALYACFSATGDHLRFQGKELSRGAVLGQLESAKSSAQRKALFLALSPLYVAINGQDEPTSPYRRLIRLAASDNAAKHKSELDSAARTLGVSASDVEHWLEQILDNWRQSTPATAVEPWDYRYQAGAADRQLAAAIPRKSLQPITERYYRDLGADLQKLRVINDLDPRPGKSPVAYTDFARRGRLVAGKWQSTIARVLANYSTGGLGNLNEFVHENGHAVQISAIHTRPAFMDWGDTLFVEAFADVTSWNTYDTQWQKKYLGQSASAADNLRALYSGVMLDVAWSLFEIRMLHDPSADPNQVWTDITNHYLHIVKHPELSWWAIRGQLVDAPGYMVNYGLGAVVTAEIRQRTFQAIGTFNTGNPRWYSWTSQHLLRFGAERETAELLRDFLGDRVSPEPLLGDLRRLRPTPGLTSGKPVLPLRTRG